jgi:hypothetical protein
MGPSRNTAILAIGAGLLSAYSFVHDNTLGGTVFGLIAVLVPCIAWWNSRAAHAGPQEGSAGARVARAFPVWGLFLGGAAYVGWRGFYLLGESNVPGAVFAFIAAACGVFLGVSAIVGAAKGKLPLP